MTSPTGMVMLRVGRKGPQWTLGRSPHPEDPWTWRCSITWAGRPHNRAYRTPCVGMVSRCAERALEWLLEASCGPYVTRAGRR